MSGIVGAHHTSFTVADIEASIAFFRDRLGLTLLGQREVDNAYFGRVVGLPGARVRAALLRVPGSDHHVELFQYLSPPGKPVAPRPCDPVARTWRCWSTTCPGYSRACAPTVLTPARWC